MLKETPKNDQKLLKEIVSLVQDSKKEVARTVNSAITLLYWQIGHKINQNILRNSRADYGQKIVSTLSKQLTWSHFSLMVNIQDDLEDAVLKEIENFILQGILQRSDGALS